MLQNMMTQINSSSPAALATLDQFARDAGGSNAQFLKFAKGEFTFGLEGNIVEQDEQFAANMGSLSRGFICWGDGEPLGEEMAPVWEASKLRRADLEDFSNEGGEWVEQASIEFTSLETDEVLVFKTSSHGGRKALGALAKAFSDRMKSGEDTVVPVVQMLSESYKHKAYGKVFVPSFEIVDWLAPAGDTVSAPDTESTNATPTADTQPTTGRVIDADDEDPFEEKPKATKKRRGRRMSV